MARVKLLSLSGRFSVMVTTRLVESLITRIASYAIDRLLARRMRNCVAAVGCGVHGSIAIAYRTGIANCASLNAPLPRACRFIRTSFGFLPLPLAALQGRRVRDP